MVFFMVSAEQTASKPAPILGFRVSEIIEWE